MSNTGSRAGSSDALSSLLTDLQGVEGNIFSRPKTLGGMKKVQQTPLKNQPSLNTSPKPPSDAPFPTSGRPPSYPSPTKQVYESTPSESHSIADLENMLQGSTPYNPATTIQLNSQGQGQTSATATPSFDDPFADFVSSPPISAQPTTDHLASTPSPSSAHLGLSGMNSVPIDEDPLDMFGGTPAPSSSTLPSHSNNDFFADFEDAPPSLATAPAGASNEPPPGQQPQQQPSRHSTPKTGIDEFTEIGLSPLPPPPPPQPLSSSPTLRTSSTTSSSSSNFKERISEQPVSKKTSHKAFQFLDAKQAAQGAGTVAAAGRTSQQSSRPSYDAEYQQQQQQQQEQGHSAGLPHPTSEGVVELGQRAAKALQAGTKWFMKASKQIATEVQSKIEKHRQHQHSSEHASGSGGGSGHMTTSHSFYFDWASQIARMSPGTRAAAMGAMQEEDRLEVQKIIDEAELGEVMLNSIEGDSSGPLEQGRRKDVYTMNDDERTFNQGNSTDMAYNGFEQQRQPEEGQRKEMPPPPSYDELMGSVTGAKTGPGGNSSATNAMNTPAPVSSAAEKATVVEHLEEDLLGMDGDGDNSIVMTSNAIGTGHIDDMFTVPKPGATAAAAVARKPSSTSTTAPAVGKVSSNAGGGLSSMIDLADSLPDVDTTGYSELYIEKESGSGINGSGGGEDPNEPEIRKILRQKRIAEKHERMMRQLAEKRAREEAEDAEKAGKVAFRDTLRPKIDAWSANKKDNIRALLSTVHTVLWEDSGWTAPSIADMVESSKVKKWYMKANLVVHPDKVKQKGGSLEQVATADMVFDVLKAAWGKFDAS